MLGWGWNLWKMLRIFVRQLFLKRFAVSPFQSNRLNTNAIASLHIRYCTLTNGVNEPSATPEKNDDKVHDAKTIQKLKRFFKCTTEEAELISNQIESLDLNLLNKKLTFLSQNGATLPALMECCYVLNLSNGKYKNHLITWSLLLIHPIRRWSIKKFQTAPLPAVEENWRLHTIVGGKPNQIEAEKN